MQKPIDHVIWDFNGTILDDCDYAVSVRNRTFPAFGLPIIHDMDAYKKAFCFPVRKYYEDAGVTDENFDAVAHAWMDEYVRGSESIPLHEGVLTALTAFQEAGIKQVVLSASEQSILETQLSFYHLLPFFEKVLGLSDIYAKSKVAIGKGYIQSHAIDPDGCILLGDTLHDADVARAMNIRCLLIANGHQLKETLLTAGVPVVDDVFEAMAYVKRHHQKS